MKTSQMSSMSWLTQGGLTQGQLDWVFNTSQESKGGQKQRVKTQRRTRCSIYTASRHKTLILFGPGAYPKATIASLSDDYTDDTK